MVKSPLYGHSQRRLERAPGRPARNAPRRVTWDSLRGAAPLRDISGAPDLIARPRASAEL